MIAIETKCEVRKVIKMKENEARILRDRINYAMPFAKEKEVREELEDILYQIDWLVQKEIESVPMFAKEEILDFALKEATRKLGEIQNEINALKDVAKDYQIIINNILDWKGDLK